MKRILKDLRLGIHTYEVGQTLTKKQFGAALERMRARGRVVPGGKGWRSCTLLDGRMPGLTVTLCPIWERNTYRVSIKVEPCRALGSHDPTELWQCSRRSYRELCERCDRYLEELGIPGGLDSMSVSRCDLTCDLVFTRQEYVNAYLRILKKACLIPGYRVSHFSGREKKAKDPGRADRCSHCIRCKQVSLLCYDKIDQLKMVGRCTEKLGGAAVLRLEAQLKRPALKRALRGAVPEDDLSLLKAAFAQTAPVLRVCLDRMFPCGGDHLRYEDAVSAVRKVKKEKLREQMGFLLRKMSDAATWNSAVRKLEAHDSTVDGRRLERIWKRFGELDVSPITLPNSSAIRRLPPLKAFLKAGA